MNRSVQRSVMAAYPGGAVAMAQLLVVDVAQLHGPRDLITQEITLVSLRF